MCCSRLSNETCKGLDWIVTSHNTLDVAIYTVFTFEINSCVLLVLNGLIPEITEKKDGDAVCVFDPRGDLPCAHEANEWGACKESKGDVLRLMRICSAYTPIWAREKEREVGHGSRGGNKINQVSINMVFVVLSTKFMKLCGPILRFPMRTKIIFRKPIKSSFQWINGM